MSVGMLTGHPAEEIPGSAGDLLSELSHLHEQVRQVMQGIAQALWPSAYLPGGMGELTEKLKGARRRFRLWKISACRQGAREAWAMVKTRYTKADPNHMAEVGPVGPDGKEIPVSLVYGQVELAAKYSQQDCRLDNLLDGIEEEFSQSKWLCTLSDIYNLPSRIVNHLSQRTFSLQPLDPTVRSVSEYPLSYVKTYAWKPGVGVISA